jgi:hypothetical protein
LSRTQNPHHGVVNIVTLPREGVQGVTSMAPI